MLIDEGADALSLTRHQIKGKPAFFSCDGANKSIYHVVKMTSFWYVNRVMTFLLDSDAAIGDNISAADASNHSLQKNDYLDSNGNIAKVAANGICADAGGGGTREGLALEMSKLERTASLTLLLIVACCLHAMNRMMQSPCEKYFGSDGVLSRNLIQLLCACYALQKEHESNEWNEIWKQTNGLPFGETF